MSKEVGPSPYLVGLHTDYSNTKATFVTPAAPLDVSLSCDSLTLSVCFKEGGTLKCLFFDVRALAVAAKVLVCTVNSVLHNTYEMMFTFTCTECREASILWHNSIYWKW